MSDITEISKGRINMGPGTLYGVLSRMEKDGLISLSEDDGRRKII
jgi:DNA-binding PadR family transcriptional regulator